MIQLTRVNHQELILNCDLIKFIEQAHDTVVTLLNGEKLTVQETPAEIVQRVIAFRRAQADTQDTVLRRLMILPSDGASDGMTPAWEAESNG